MAYPSAHWLLTFGGTINASETWTTTLRIAGTHPATQAANQAACDAYATAVNNSFTTRNFFTNKATLGQVKLNWVDEDGKYVDPWTNVVDYVPEHVNAASGTIVLPSQCAWVVSLGTAVARGPAHAGRMYWPYPNQALNSDGRMTLAQADAASGQMVQFINAIKAVTIVSGVPAIYSKIGTGFVHPITRLSVGRVVDTMRSRRTSQAEERVWVTL